MPSRTTPPALGSPRPSLARLARAASLTLFAAAAACGPKAPIADPTAPPSGDLPAAPPAASAPALSPSPAAAPAVSASAGAASAAPASSRPLDSALVPKTTSAGGTYALNALSATGLTIADVVNTAGEASPKTDACYAKLFKKQVTVVGKTTFKITVDAKGKTRSVALVVDELHDPDLVSCLTGVLNKLSWPKPSDPAGGAAVVQWAVAGG